MEEQVIQLTYLYLNSHLTAEIMSSMSKITPFRSDRGGKFASASPYKTMIKVESTQYKRQFALALKKQLDIMKWLYPERQLEISKQVSKIYILRHLSYLVRPSD